MRDSNPRPTACKADYELWRGLATFGRLRRSPSFHALYAFSPPAARGRFRRIPAASLVCGLVCTPGWMLTKLPAENGSHRDSNTHPWAGLRSRSQSTATPVDDRNSSHPVEAAIFGYNSDTYFARGRVKATGSVGSRCEQSAGSYPSMAKALERFGENCRHLVVGWGNARPAAAV